MFKKNLLCKNCTRYFKVVKLQVARYFKPLEVLRFDSNDAYVYYIFLVI